MKKLLLGLALLVSTAGAIAEDNAAMVVASRGEVSAMSDGISRKLYQGDHVFVEDKITTENRSFVILQFVDGTKVTVRPDSVMFIESYSYINNEEDETTLNLVSGGLRVITGAMAKSNPENYKVRTPVALMGVRGTEFSLFYK